MIENVRAVYFPYCLEQQEDGSWVLLNRNYKPVGFNTGDFIRYEEHPVSIRLRGIGPATLKRLAFDGEIKGEGAKPYVMLYNDGCVPTLSTDHMASYLQKLEILMKLKTE